MRNQWGVNNPNWKGGAELSAERRKVSKKTYDKIYRKKYYLAHKEKYDRINKLRRKTHPDKRDRKVYMKAWKLEHPEYMKQYSREYYLLCPGKFKAYGRKQYLADPKASLKQSTEWRKEHPEQSRKHHAKYRKTPKGKEVRRRIKAKRRELGFVPVNNYFDGAAGHHINGQIVIYIPKEMHTCNPHSVLRNKGMDKINTLAFNWLEAEELYAWV